MDNQSVSPETKQPSVIWKRIKTITKGIAIFIVVLIVAVVWQTMNGQSAERQLQKTTQQTEQPKQEEVSAPQEEPKPEPFNIEVTSQIVKKVDGKYRYFFDIRNKDTKSFDGKVTINLLKANGNKLGSTTIDEDKSIEPNLGIARFIDANTGPAPIYNADLAITKFTYEVKIDNKVVKSGEGVISDKFEDLN